MENNELIELENEEMEAAETETEKSGNGLKTVGVLALTAVVGAGLYFGAKKLVKKIKEHRKEKTIEVSIDDDSDCEDEKE